MASAQSIDEDVSVIEGTYTGSNEVEGSLSFEHLNCFKEKIEVGFGEDERLILQTPFFYQSPMVFEGVGEGVIGASGPLLGYSQRRTRMRDSEDSIKYVTERRDCAIGILKGIGCLGVTWRKVKEAQFLFEKDQVVELRVFYHPFSTQPEEQCVFYPTVTEKK